MQLAGSILALSVTYGDTSPKGRGLGKEMNFAWTAKGSPFGRAAEQRGAERASPLKGKHKSFDILSALLRHILRPAAGKLGAKRR